mmetsp:Transcript_32674/g.78001  ORF Transcript_32674/g.78001 Transcript_32674/m.78001 type:complete len:395 (-) Transcript_32674:50-1234(-)
MPPCLPPGAGISIVTTYRYRGRPQSGRSGGSERDRVTQRFFKMPSNAYTGRKIVIVSISCVLLRYTRLDISKLRQQNEILKRHIRATASVNSQAVVPSRANLGDSFLVYFHIPKTGGTSFNKMLMKEPLSRASSNMDIKYNEEHTPANLNCRYLKTYKALDIAQMVDKVLEHCNHLTYEGSWPFFEDVARRKSNALLLMHLRSPIWHVISMLGHDFQQGRYETYAEKLDDSKESIPSPGAGSTSWGANGYILDNHVHVNFDTQNTTKIAETLDKDFFWFGITEHTKASWCLLLWQLGVFDRDYCRGLCGETRSSNETGEADAYVVSNTFGNNRLKRSIDMGAHNTTLSQAHLKGIQARTRKDQALYDAALVLFHRRVDHVEKEVGFRFLHCLSK